MQIISILHRALQMGTGRREGPDLTGRRLYQDAGLRAKFENHTGIGPQFTYPSSKDVRLRRFNYFGGNEESQDGIEDRDQSAANARAKKEIDKSPPCLHRSDRLFHARASLKR